MSKYLVSNAFKLRGSQSSTSGASLKEQHIWNEEHQRCLMPVPLHFCDRAYSLHSKVTNAICKRDTCQVNTTALAGLNSLEDLNCTYFEGKGIHNKNAAKILFCCIQCLLMNKTTGLTCLCLTSRSYHMHLSLQKCWKINSVLTVWSSRVLSQISDLSVKSHTYLVQ